MASSSSYVRYVIESPGLEAQRRYSEFEALRAALVALHPMLLLPPLPDKTSLTAYALQQRQAKTDPATTAKRLRLLERFLQRLDTHPVLRQDVVLRRFLDGRYPWQEIKTSPPLTTLPPSTFTAPPSAPADPDAPAWYASLPLPAGTGSLREPNGRYAASEAFTDKFQTHLASMIEPRNRRLAHRWRDVAHDWDELSDVLTAQSAAEAPALAPAVERAAHAAAATRDAIRAMDADWEARVTEPWHEYTQYGHIVHALLQWRHKKQWQLERAQDMLAEKRARLDALERVEADAARWQRALETGGRSLVVTDTPAHAPASSVYGSAAEAAADDPWAPAPSATEDRTPAPPSRDAPAAREPHAHAAPPRPPPARGLLGTLSDSVSTLLDRDPTRTRHTHIAELQHDVAAVRRLSHTSLSTRPRALPRTSR